MQDAHAALQVDKLQKTAAAGVEFVLTKLVWDKEDIGYSLHAVQNGADSNGMQIADFLAYIGFQRGRCPYVEKGECYSRIVRDRIDLYAFSVAFEKAFYLLRSAQLQLELCGFFMAQPEGWGHFYGKRSSDVPARFGDQPQGNGHTGPNPETQAQTEDENFRFALSWIGDGLDKGWTIHYKPKQKSVSPELQSVFRFLKFRFFPNCPNFDFDVCYWRFLAFQEHYQTSGAGNAESNSGTTQSWFYAHPRYFSAAIQQLLEAHAVIEKFGMGFLPVPSDAPTRREAEIQRHTTRPKTETVGQSAAAAPLDFDVAISFAGTEREYAETIATIVHDAGFTPFYDNFYTASLWGKDLVEFFDDIYRKRSRYCVMFVSKEYAHRMWTTHERRSALARRVQERDKDYILPIRVDATDLPGLPPTVGYLALADHGISKIGQMLVQRLAAKDESALTERPSKPSPASAPASELLSPGLQRRVDAVEISVELLQGYAQYFQIRLENQSAEDLIVEQVRLESEKKHQLTNPYRPPADKKRVMAPHNRPENRLAISWQASPDPAFELAKVYNIHDRTFPADLVVRTLCQVLGMPKWCENTLRVQVDPRNRNITQF